jgi:hypothetical protein
MRPLILLIALAGPACSAEVQNGLPPLTTGCETTADCSIAGPQFACVAGGCMVLSCTCDRDCTADTGLHCYSANQATNDLQGNQCLDIAASLGTPCDGG